MSHLAIPSVSIESYRQEHCIMSKPAQTSPEPMSALEEHLRYGDDYYFDRRSAEEGHTKACLASAMIAAVQNWRDAEGISDHDFVLWAQDNEALAEAYDYLNVSQLSDCLCPQVRREEKRYFTVFTWTKETGNTPFRKILFCTLTDAIMEAEEGRVYDPEVTSLAVGHDFYGNGAGTYVWMSLDFNSTQA